MLILQIEYVSNVSIHRVMSRKSQTSICPLCGSTDTCHFADCKDHAVSNETYELVQCKSCGIIFTDGTPLEEHKENYSKLNQELTRADNPKRLLDKVYYYMRFISIRRRVRLILDQTRLKEGRLLNYGAKSGYFSSRMENIGWHVTSLEEYHEHRVLSLELFHHRMMELTEIDSLPHGSYDAVTLWHTFEHESNPGVLIDKIYSLLKPNGVLLIACPNIESYDALHYGREWAAWDVPRHRWHFNPSSLMSFCLRHKFILMYHKRMPFDVFYISLLSEKYRGSHFAVLKGFFVGLHYWFKTIWKRDKSSSIVYIFRKKLNESNG